MTLLSCEHLSLGYEGRAVVSDLHFTVDKGEYLCILGENGSGKTTLMKTILGLMKPLEGQVRTLGGLRQEEIGYLPQQSLAQRDFPASVREVVLSGCLNRSAWRPWYSGQQKDRADMSMARLKIENLARRCYRQLSGGQQQRVLLARALCAADKLLLLDEPASGLDPSITEELYQVIGELNQQGLAILMISHDVQAAIRQATHILHIASKPLFYGTAAAYLASDIGQIYALKEAAAC